MERTLIQIHPSVDPDLIDGTGIRALGPTLLGEASWALIVQDVNSSIDWFGFKKLVDDQFGVSEVRIR